MKPQWKARSARCSFEDHELKTNRFKISVFNGHVNKPNVWVISCFLLGLNAHELGATDADDAKVKAVKLVRDKLTEMLDSLGGVE